MAEGWLWRIRVFFLGTGVRVPIKGDPIIIPAGTMLKVTSFGIEPATPAQEEEK